MAFNLNITASARLAPSCLCSLLGLLLGLELDDELVTLHRLPDLAVRSEEGGGEGRGEGGEEGRGRRGEGEEDGRWKEIKRKTPRDTGFGGGTGKRGKSHVHTLV